MLEWIVLATMLQEQKWSVSLGWDDPNPPSVEVIKYTLYWGEGKSCPCPNKIDVPGSEKTVTVHELSSGWHTFEVTAWNAAGESPPSEELTIRPKEKLNGG